MSLQWKKGVCTSYSLIITSGIESVTKFHPERTKLEGLLQKEGGKEGGCLFVNLEVSDHPEVLRL